MSYFTVDGGHKLQGRITVTGNKNEALPLISAALLTPHKADFFNVPDIGDVSTMLDIARHLGAKVSPLSKGRVSIAAPRLATSTIPVKLSSDVRGSILFASSLLARTGTAVIPQPGGDAIGRRRLDTHFSVFEALGATLHTERVSQHGNQPAQVIYTLEAKKGLVGAEIHLDEASVTATENALIAAAGARGTTVIANAASEPHVQGLCWFLQKMGVKIRGIGSNMLTVRGTGEFSGAEHVVSSDYIEAASFIGLAAATRSEIDILNVNPQTLRMILFQFGRLGIEVEADARKRMIHVPGRQHLRIRKDLGGAIPKFEDAPWPGFPADLVSILLVAATQCEGTCLIHEKMFEARLFFVDKLLNMGAQIVLCDPHRAVIVGPSKLFGSTIASPDIRAGMALLIAALAADGRSVIHNIEQIDRGYQNIHERLAALGAHITRVADRRNRS